MTLTIEDGSVVENADSFVTLAAAIARATSLGNLTFADLDQTEQQEPALRVGFEYLTTRWESHWKGSRFRGQDFGDGVSVANVVDVFFTAPDTIGSTTTDLSVFSDGQTIRIVSDSKLNDADYHITGTPGATSMTVTEQTITTEGAGQEVLIEGVLLEQIASWPRNHVITPEGHRFPNNEIPADILTAQIEYALVAVGQSFNLSPVPVVDASGRPLTKLEQGVGPLKQTKEWAEGVVQPIVIREYPRPDSWVQRWVVPQGGVIR